MMVDWVGGRVGR